jgi:ribonuclease BN (tRNA processing enzyme)
VKQLTVSFAGVGGAFADSRLWNNQPVVTLTDDAKKVTILVDCSPDARHSLQGIGISAADVDAVLFTHFHGDHIHGLEWLGFYNRFVSKASRKPLIIEPLRPSATNSVYNTLNGVFQPSMGPIEDADLQLIDYFGFTQCLPFAFKGREPTTIELNGISFQVAYYKLPHIRQVDDAQNPRDIGITYGYMLTYAGKSIFFTSDCQFNSLLMEPIYAYADKVFHDCADYETTSRVHARLVDLLTYPADWQSKTILCHHSGKARKGEYGNFTMAMPGHSLVIGHAD